MAVLGKDEQQLLFRSPVVSCSSKTQSPASPEIFQNSVFQVLKIISFWYFHSLHIMYTEQITFGRTDSLPIQGQSMHIHFCNFSFPYLLQFFFVHLAYLVNLNQFYPNLSLDILYFVTLVKGIFPSMIFPKSLSSSCRNTIYCLCYYTPNLLSLPCFSLFEIG